MTIDDPRGCIICGAPTTNPTCPRIDNPHAAARADEAAASHEGNPT